MSDDDDIFYCAYCEEIAPTNVNPFGWYKVHTESCEESEITKHRNAMIEAKSAMIEALNGSMHGCSTWLDKFGDIYQ